MKELVENIKELNYQDNEGNASQDQIKSYRAGINDAVEFVKEYQEDLFSELRWLLKEHAQFPKQWDTNERLIEWLKEKGEYQ
jgi:uncharacterized coiled-coil DUF342 family protein